LQNFRDESLVCADIHHINESTSSISIICGPLEANAKYYHKISHS
jgi:hypothetical protein